MASAHEAFKQLRNRGKLKKLPGADGEAVIAQRFPLSSYFE
jgi:hypothetical protein